MIQFNTPTRIAFISSYPTGACPIARFTSNLVDNMIPASYGAFEPVMIVVESEVSREYTDEVNFVIRRDFKSDYMEAADFINAGNGDAVIIQYHWGLFGDVGGSCIGDLLKRVDAPVITTLHEITENPTACQFQNLINICDASERLIVMNQRHLALLNKQYAISLNKIDCIAHHRPDNPFDQQMRWFYIGRQYWDLVSGQLKCLGSDLRSLQTSRERALMFE